LHCVSDHAVFPVATIKDLEPYVHDYFAKPFDIKEFIENSDCSPP
jgi:hypothetical protein